jgi:acetyl-CoA carboxylase biotin carboxyl carrier protein
MEFEKIRELIEKLTGLMDSKGLDELEIEADGLKVALRRGRGAESPAAAAPPPVAPPAPAEPKPAANAPEAPENVHIIRSPMVGTVYRASSPDAEPFAEVGDEIAPDTVLCLIEAMKVMNELKAEVEGVLQAIYVENGETIEYGQPLFVVAKKKG